jgi:hypothetical protein
MTFTANQTVATVINQLVNFDFPATNRRSMAVANGSTAVTTRA